MNRAVRHALHDILQTMERLELKTRNKTLAEFEADWEMQFIVARGIEILRGHSAVA